MKTCFTFKIFLRTWGKQRRWGQTKANKGGEDTCSQFPNPLLEKWVRKKMGRKKNRINLQKMRNSILATFFFSLFFGHHVVHLTTRALAQSSKDFDARAACLDKIFSEKKKEKRNVQWSLRHSFVMNNGVQWAYRFWTAKSAF